jgi:hypothetical protein
MREEYGGEPGVTPGGAPRDLATEPGASLVRIGELPKTELRTWRLYAVNGAPLPLYLRYMGGTWWAIAPAREVRLGLPGARSIIVTADSPREAADALWELLDRLGTCVAYPELAGLA